MLRDLSRFEAQAAVQRLHPPSSAIHPDPWPSSVPWQATAEIAPEEAIRALQTMLPPAPRVPLEPVELENVSPALLVNDDNYVCLSSRPFRATT